MNGPIIHHHICLLLLSGGFCHGPDVSERSLLEEPSQPVLSAQREGDGQHDLVPVGKLVHQVTSGQEGRPEEDDTSHPGKLF